MDIRLSVDHWNMVSEKGLPKDGDWCFVVWRSEDGALHWNAGGYNEKEAEFYINFGYGGLVLEAKDVVAWADFFGGANFEVQGQERGSV